MGIWWFALGYFLCYVPYSALAKAISAGAMPELGEAVPGLVLLPSTVLASVVGMYTFITLMGWWRYASRRRIGGVELPFPGGWTFLSGLCTAVIIGTTTLAYTLQGVSIVFMMLLMRGGLLILAPLIDRLTGRHVRWFSWAALGLSLAALIVAFAEGGGFAFTSLALLDVTAYLGAYFIRLRFMSRLAKSSDREATLRYFVEEQMVAAPVLLTGLALSAALLTGEVPTLLREGFTDFFQSPLLPLGLLTGLLSQGTGIFGGLILLDRRENAYCVPVNRSSSILAGVVASWLLTFFLDRPAPSSGQLLGAALIIGAVLFLSLPPLLEKRRLERAAQPPPTA